MPKHLKNRKEGLTPQPGHAKPQGSLSGFLEHFDRQNVLYGSHHPHTHAWKCCQDEAKGTKADRVVNACSPSTGRLRQEDYRDFQGSMNNNVWN